MYKNLFRITLHGSAIALILVACTAAKPTPASVAVQPAATVTELPTVTATLQPTATVTEPPTAPVTPQATTSMVGGG